MIRVLFYFFRRGSRPFQLALVRSLLLIGLLLWYAVSGFLYFELPQNPDLSLGDALWWAVVTMTTVGYGDLFPETTGGRYLVAVPTMLVGIGILGYFLSELASHIIENRSRRLRGMSEIKINDHILLVNYVNEEKIESLVQEIRNDSATAGVPICLVDEHLKELPGWLDEMNVQFVRGNPTRRDTLRRAAAGQARSIILLAGNPSDLHSDNLTLSTAIMARQFTKKARLLAEVVDPSKSEQLEAVGCDSVVCLADFGVNLLVQELQDSGVKEVFHQLMSNLYGQQIYFVPVRPPEGGGKYEGLQHWALENHYTLLGIHQEGVTNLNPPPETNLSGEVKAILIGQTRPVGPIVTA